jgi:hypothetical protein
MNTIEAAKYQPPYLDFEYRMLWVDGKPLDELLLESLPQEPLLGLVPSITMRHVDDKELESVIERILPGVGDVEVAPVLFCPDCGDFACNTLVTEVEVNGDTVIWRRLGLDQTPAENLPLIGVEVKWYDGIGPFQFDKKRMKIVSPT